MVKLMKLNNSYFDQKGYIKNSSARWEKAENLEKNIGKNIIVKHDSSSRCSSNYIVGEVVSVNLNENYYLLSIIEEGKNKSKRFPLGNLEFIAVGS